MYRAKVKRYSPSLNKDKAYYLMKQNSFNVSHLPVGKTRICSVSYPQLEPL